MSSVVLLTVYNDVAPASAQSYAASTSGAPQPAPLTQLIVSCQPAIICETALVEMSLTSEVEVFQS